MLQSPTVSKLKLLPLVLHTAGVLEANETTRPDVALATKAAAGVPRRCAVGMAKLMLCAKGAAATTKVTVTGNAAA